jgi:hypothetical protein
MKVGAWRVRAGELARLAGLTLGGVTSLAEVREGGGSDYVPAARRRRAVIPTGGRAGSSTGTRSDAVLGPF